MLTQLLFFNTAHFALSALTTFVFFATGLLFLDSWQIDKIKKTPLIRSAGFFALAVVSALHAASLNIPAVELLMQILRIIGLVLILFSLVGEPILHKSGREELKVIVPLVLSPLTFALISLSGVLILIIAIYYLRRATEGLDRQLKPAAIAFFLLSLAEFAHISFFWSDTTDILLSKALAEYGLLWNIQHTLELVGISILALWTWGYIRFRLQVQLFATTVILTISIFLITTFFSTFLLLKNLEEDALAHLKTDVNVLRYALDRLQLEILSDAKAIAQDSDFKQAFLKNDSSKLYEITSEFMLSQKTSFLTVASSSGEVLMRAEDREKSGDVIPNEPVVQSALEGKPLATIVSREGVIYPQVFVKAAVPIKENLSTQSGNIRGVVVTGFVIDSAFVDGVKDVTGLDVAVFGGNKRAATTFVTPDGNTRFIGTVETNKKIINTVLEKGEVYIGASSVLNIPYYTAYSPLKTFGDKTIGIIFVGKPQTTLFDTAKKLIDAYFLGSVILIVLTLIPAYFFSRYLEEHLEA